MVGRVDLGFWGKIGPAVLISGLGCALGVLPPSADATDAAAASATHVVATRITSYTEPKGRTVVIRAAGGYCVGERPPVIDKVSVRESAIGTRGRAKALITVFLRKRVRPEESAPPPSEETKTVKVCQGIEHSLDQLVRLGRPASKLLLYDGSITPPRRIPR
jgi:hypothetical protein